DAADASGEVDDDVWLQLLVHRRDLFGPPQVVVRAGRREDRRGLAGPQALDDGLAEEAAGTGDEHTARRPEREVERRRVGHGAPAYRPIRTGRAGAPWLLGRARLARRGPTVARRGDARAVLAPRAGRHRSRHARVGRRPRPAR